MTKKGKKLVIFNSIILLLVCTYTIGMHYQNVKKLNESIPEVKLKEIVNKEKTMAIMISSDGSNYQEYNSDTWPSNSYKFKEAKCIDNSGDEVKEAVTYEEGKITLTTNKTVYCTVYFDYKGTIEILKETDSNKNLSSDLQGGMYRYQGTDDVRNWICFGTTDNCGTNEDDIDKYMYRIIGITQEGQLYLIKETFVKEENLTGFAWNAKSHMSGSEVYVCSNGKCPEWNETDIFLRINGISNGEKKGKGSCYPSCDGANTDIFVDSTQYEYLKSGDNINGGETSSVWYNLIENHKWLYGDIADIEIVNTYNGQTLYEIESGLTTVKHYIGTVENVTEETYTWNQNVNAKIGLMYMHDYCFSYYDGISEDSRGNAKDYNILKNSWLHFRKDNYNFSNNYEWLITRHGIIKTSIVYTPAYDISYDGSFPTGASWHDFAVRPTFYVKNDIQISGEGTKDNPFIINF